MSNSVRPHRWQPTRLPRPWDSPGKNTGVGCHFLLQCTKVKSQSEVKSSVVSDSQRPHGLQPTRPLCPWDLPGKSTGMGCHCLLRETALDASNLKELGLIAHIWASQASLGHHFLTSFHSSRSLSLTSFFKYLI